MPDMTDREINAAIARIDLRCRKDRYGRYTIRYSDGSSSVSGLEPPPYTTDPTLLFGPPNPANDDHGGVVWQAMRNSAKTEICGPEWDAHYQRWTVDWAQGKDYDTASDPCPLRATALALAAIARLVGEMEGGG